MFTTKWNNETFYGEHARADRDRRWDELRKVRRHVVRFTDQEFVRLANGKMVGEMVYVVAWPGMPLLKGSPYHAGTVVK